MTESKRLGLVNPEPTQRSPGFKIHRPHYRTWGPKIARFADTYNSSQWALQLLLEGNPKVRAYCEEFPRIDEYVHGKRLRHVFSFWVDYGEGPAELIEVVARRSLVLNAAGDLEPERWRDKTEWATQHGLCCRYLVKGTGELKNAVLIENWAQILPHVQCGLARPNPALAERILGAVRSREAHTLADLPRIFPAEDPQSLHEVLFVLLHAGWVRIDLTREPLNPTLRLEAVHDAPSPA